MAKRTIGLGSNANDNTGDTIRAGGTKINANFDDIWSGVFRWVEKNVNYTAVAGDKVLVDSVAAARTITLPASALFGQEITVCDAKGSAGTNNITINRNGHLIQGSANNAVINLNFGVKTYVYESATKGWIENTAASSGINQLDNVGNVTITSNSAGELLKWNGSAWINNTLVEAGVAALTGSTNNTVVTVTGAHLIQGEGNLTFDGSTLAVTGAATISTTLGVTGVTTLSEDVTLTGAAANAVWDKSDNALEFADNAKVKFGTGNDLQIWHDGSHSHIADGGTGNLKIQASQLDIIGTGETMATFVDDGAVSLYFNNVNALQTTATGLQVNTGIVDVKNAGTASSIKLYCETANSHNVEIKSPAHAGFSGGSWTMTLPGVNGDPGGVLQTNGAGVTSWATWTAVSSATTAVAGGKYLVNTSSAAVTLTLPASPAAGAEVTVLDANKTFDTNALTIGRGGQPINGTASDLTVNTESAGFTLVYSNATQGWLYREV